MTDALDVDAPQRSWPGQRHVSGAVCVGLILLSLPIFLDSIQLQRLAMSLALFLAILGVNLSTGYCGLISLGHGAFVGIGAFGTAWFLDAEHLPWPAAIAGGVLTAGVAGLLIGAPALRLRGIHLALVTLAIAVMFQPLARQFPQFSGGVSGKAVAARIVAPGWLGDGRLADTMWQLCIVIFSCLVGLLVVHNLVNSQWGRSMRAVRDDERAAAVYGINLTIVRTGAFAMSAALAGLAGAMQVVLFPWVSPDAYTTFDSLTIYAVAVIGGLGTLRGSVLGVAALIVVPRFQSLLSSSVDGVSSPWLDLLGSDALVFGGALTALALVFPGGLAAVDTAPITKFGRRFFGLFFVIGRFLKRRYSTF
jgi:branched-chain amino acid transport system permease protein